MKILEAYKAKVGLYLMFLIIAIVDCTVNVLVCQDEQYDHLDELEVLKVEKQVNDAMTWLNNKMNEQSKQSLTAQPVVKAHEIHAKTKVQSTCAIFLIF